MSKEDWYRNTEWNDQIEFEFESRFNRCRGNYHKAQYLRIQASHLLDSKKSKHQEKGIELMERVISKYPEEKFSTIHGIEQLGEFYLKNESFDKAEKHFREVIDYYYTETRSGTSGLADLKLCETILKSEQEEKFEEAYEIATKTFKATGGSLFFNSDKYYYADLMANLCYKMKRKDEATLFAQTAMELSKITEPQFSRHKTFGIIKIVKEKLERLKKILE
jgi:tetratricopeptide (TPR) repeat protein